MMGRYTAKIEIVGPDEFTVVANSDETRANVYAVQRILDEHEDRKKTQDERKHATWLFERARQDGDARGAIRFLSEHPLCPQCGKRMV